MIIIKEYNNSAQTKRYRVSRILSFYCRFLIQSIKQSKIPFHIGSSISIWSWSWWLGRCRVQFMSSSPTRYVCSTCRCRMDLHRFLNVTFKWLLVFVCAFAFLDRGPFTNMARKTIRQRPRKECQSGLRFRGTRLHGPKFARRSRWANSHSLHLGRDQIQRGNWGKMTTCLVILQYLIRLQREREREREREKR